MIAGLGHTKDILGFSLSILDLIKVIIHAVSLQGGIVLADFPENIDQKWVPPHEVTIRNIDILTGPQFI